MNKWDLKIIKNGVIINEYRCDDLNLLSRVIDYFIYIDKKYEYEIKRVNNNV